MRKKRVTWICAVSLRLTWSRQGVKAHPTPTPRSTTSPPLSRRRTFEPQWEQSQPAHLLADVGRRADCGSGIGTGRRRGRTASEETRRQSPDTHRSRRRCSQSLTQRAQCCPGTENARRGVGEELRPRLRSIAESWAR
ncbi:hypothetical protein AAFF_G00060490 [Aldrovandia affinis]|uniref:Secreted protein n=1 Tax=Aldrovandia affinis TaxID=143900 RepID=A0AAD7S2K1_9TELE|nr:hypothetical protein AAFF_G00060490 [Aldrovandia affinis]